MLGKSAILAIAALVAAPAIATAAWPRADESGVASREVELRGPIRGFQQWAHRVEVRLSPASHADSSERHDLVVRTQGEANQAAEIAVPLKRGQTFVSVHLPEAVARAPALIISVE
jgi:hypothetical protein